MNVGIKSFWGLFIVKIFSEIIFSSNLKIFRAEYDVSLFRLRFKDSKLLVSGVSMGLKALLFVLLKLPLQLVKPFLDQ